MPSTKPWCPATITSAGEPGKHYGEPRATIVDEQYAKLTGRPALRKDMPLGRNIGQVIPVGMKGFARYEMDSRSGLWRFVTELPEGETP